MRMKMKLDTKGRSILLTDLLAENGLQLQTPCGGQGTCGKCAVRVLSGDARVLNPEQEKRLRSEGLLAEDEHLACQLKVCGSLEIEPGYGDEAGFYIPENSAAQDHEHAGQVTADDFAVLIDIGTTTVCFALTDLKGENVYAKTGLLNSQRRFGADVISRIRAAGEGHGAEMQQLICEDLKAGIRQLILAAGLQNADFVQKILVAGNTTMLHLLRGRDVSGLGRYPFTPVSLEMEEMLFGDLSGDGELCGLARVTILPGISAFVGADITAGLLSLQELKKPAFFIDLGTNAEMALLTGDRLFVSSAAAGPAFEGGNISCGTGSIPGAVSRAWRQYGLWRYETIEKQVPTGICGSGLISLIAAMLRAGMIDRHGTLQDKFRGSVEPVPGRVSVTQADIRAFQEAKAAVRSGIRLLLEAAGLAGEDISSLCLAGSFGGGIDSEDACTAGLFPEIFAGKIRAAGNTVLTGLQQYLQDGSPEKLRHITENAAVVNLPLQDDFQAMYIHYLDFR